MLTKKMNGTDDNVYVPVCLCVCLIHRLSFISMLIFIDSRIIEFDAKHRKCNASIKRIWMGDGPQKSQWYGNRIE